MLVLALDADSSLSAALNMMHEWDVVFVGDVEQVLARSDDANVLLVGGGTIEGLRRVAELRARGALVPAIVLGDEPSTGDVPVLVPPYSLQELRICVESTARPSTAPAREYVDPYAYERDDEDEVEDDLEALEQAFGLPAATPETRPGVPADPVPPRSAYAQPPTRPVHAPAPSAEQVKPEEPRRRVLRRRGEAAPQGLMERLYRAARSMRDVELLLDDLPVLADLEGLANVLVSEIADKLEPETAAVFVDGPGGYRAWGAHSLSRAEQTMTVPANHALVAELAATHRPVLVPRVELAQGLVAGIGGARTTAIAAAPVEVDERMVGFVMAGADRFTDRQLTLLHDLAREAAPGIAIAQVCARMRM